MGLQKDFFDDSPENHKKIEAGEEVNQGGVCIGDKKVEKWR